MQAAHREQALRAKLNQLQELLAESHHASDSTWQALIDEDRLLSRIETLEGRIALLKKVRHPFTIPRSVEHRGQAARRGRAAPHREGGVRSQGQGERTQNTPGEDGGSYETL